MTHEAIAQPQPHRPATVAVTAGRPARPQGAPVNPPLVLSSTYVSQGVPGADELLYTRSGTETWMPFEAAVAELEGAAQPGVVFGSGMAAVAAALAHVSSSRGGGVLVVPRHAYQVSLGY